MNCPNCGNELDKEQADQRITLPQAPKIVALALICEACHQETLWITRTDDPTTEILAGKPEEATA